MYNLEEEDMAEELLKMPILKFIKFIKLSDDCFLESRRLLFNYAKYYYPKKFEKYEDITDIDNYDKLIMFNNELFKAKRELDEYFSTHVIKFWEM